MIRVKVALLLNKLFAGETVEILVEFLEVAITSIIFLKGIYPSGTIISLTYLPRILLYSLFLGKDGGSMKFISLYFYQLVNKYWFMGEI